MLVIMLLVTQLLGGSCLKIPVLDLSENKFELTCIANITRQYFTGAKSVAYLYLDTDIDVLLKDLHLLEIVTFNRKGKARVVKPNPVYMVVASSVPAFLKRDIQDLLPESSWNPYACFLVIFKTLRTDELRQVFDIFLNYRVSNLVVLNGTSTTELYTYNPYENFACGRYYTRVIYYGKCSDVTADIYPNKVITGLRNCFYNVSVPHWPPWGIDPSKLNGDPNVIGTEQYIFHLMSEVEQFKYKFYINYDPEAFSTVNENMEITGPMVKLAENKTDVMLGGLMLIPSRANVFSYVSGHLDYLDEVRLIVQRAGRTPAWKDVYFEFSPTVWALLLLTLILYSALVVILLKTKDNVQVVLVLLDGLLAHGSKFRCRQPVKCVVIIWVLFAYLVNCFYTTTLMSLTTSPSLSYQVTDEQTVIEQGLEPCISMVMGSYLKSEHNHGEILKDVEIGSEGCGKLMDSITTVSKSNRKFTIILYSIYFVTRQQFYDEYGYSPIYSFSKPYTKVIYGIYFAKGFPMQDRLFDLALRIREVGLSDKGLKDLYFNQTLKYRFRSAGFTARFAIPWYLYAFGLTVSTITFVVEITFRYIKTQVAINKLRW